MRGSDRGVPFLYAYRVMIHEQSCVNDTTCERNEHQIKIMNN